MRGKNEHQCVIGMIRITALYVLMLNYGSHTHTHRPDKVSKDQIKDRSPVKVRTGLLLYTFSNIRVNNLRRNDSVNDYILPAPTFIPQ